MNKYIRCSLLWLLTFVPLSLLATDDVQTMQQMVKRLFPEHKDHIIFIQGEDTGKDYYQLETITNKLIVSGNNANSMAVGLNYYLKYYCQTTVSWYSGDSIAMPRILPAIKQKISSEARCQNRFFLNYCTFGYTMPWWKWEDWERLIDWMALNGVNMPLAITGQEYVWHKVWTKLGLTDQEVRSYFTGPAHLPWHRMSNLDNWQGGLSIEWLENQKELQKLILKRERKLCMRPVLPAFAGHVPKELKRLYPNARISQMSSWGGFEDKYRSHFLDPLDPLFANIQKVFLEEQTKQFGTDNIYGADPFNEVMPPSWEPDFLATCSKQIYKSISDVDPKATWLQMTWLFYIDRELWTNERVEAFLKAVPQDKMLLLDYYCENTEVWKQTKSYFGQPYLWCYLGNFGGNTMLAGNIKEVGARIENAFKNGGNNLWGLGSTLEGFDVNPLMYEFVFEKAWGNQKTDEDWIASLADRRIGTKDKNYRNAWKLLYDSIYVTPSALGQGTLTNARPTLEGHGNWTTNPTIVYTNQTLLKAWELMLLPTKHDYASYQYDITNIARQVLSNYYLVLRNEFTQLYKDRNLNKLKEKGHQMKELMRDLDRLLCSQSSFLLGKWINDARAFGTNESSRSYYEQNARTILSTWGDKAQSLNEYANRSWGGLISSYYLPKWSLFIDSVVKAVEQNQNFNEIRFIDEVTSFEINWVKSLSYHSHYPEGNSYDIAKELFNKYKNEIQGKH